MIIKNIDHLKEELISRGWYVFPTVDVYHLTVQEWGTILNSLNLGDEKYVCHAIKTYVKNDTSFISEGLNRNGTVTNWFFDETGYFLEDYFQCEEGSVSTLYRILWIEYILEHYYD